MFCALTAYFGFNGIQLANTLQGFLGGGGRMPDMHIVDFSTRMRQTGRLFNSSIFIQFIEASIGISLQYTLVVL
jgi:hypothetical protein